MSKEKEDFLYKILNLLENAENFMKRNKHIIAYNQILGIQQKLDRLDGEDKVLLGREKIRTDGTILYLKEGQYEKASENIKELKVNFYKIYEKIKNEKNNNKKV
ncbi:MAG TPA: hypothetical protein VMZ91_02590 [Candidatus Paceibacterota bacterium]|nr:hypothetical protein [Candidatus Paceibacterota bacterium]